LKCDYTHLSQMILDFAPPTLRTMGESLSRKEDSSHIHVLAYMIHTNRLYLRLLVPSSQIVHHFFYVAPTIALALFVLSPNLKFLFFPSIDMRCTFLFCQMKFLVLLTLSDSLCTNVVLYSFLFLSLSNFHKLHPSSVIIFCPVMKADSSESRNKIAPATS